MKYPTQVNPQGRDTEWWLPEAEGRRVGRYRVSFWGYDNVWNQTEVTAAHTVNRLNTPERFTLKWLIL